MNMDFIKNALGRTGLLIQKNSPEILLGTGIASMVVGTVLACRATLKVEEIIQRRDDILHSIKEVAENPEEYEEEYTQKDQQSDKFLAYGGMVKDLAKVYWPAASFMVGGAVCIFGGFGILKSRNVALMAAYKALEESFGYYRRRVVEEFGYEKDKEYRAGVYQRAEKIEVIDPETGKKKKEIMHIDEKDPQHRIYSQYARFFDESNPNWTKDPQLNLLFVRSQQSYANDLLVARGHLFLNEVYDMLSMDRTKAGAVVGWVVSDDGDNFVDFGIYASNMANRNFINGYERNILLDFNVDGVIYDLI